MACARVNSARLMRCGSGCQQPDAIAVPVPRELVRAELGERRLRTPRCGAKQLAGRAHRRIARVVADARERPVAQRARRGNAARRRRRPPRSSGASGGRRSSGQTFEAGPGLSRGRARSRVGAAVVEQVELDELDALVLEVEERAFDAAAILARPAPAARASVARAPVVGPVDPRRRAIADRALTAAAAARSPPRPCRGSACCARRRSGASRPGGPSGSRPGSARRSAGRTRRAPRPRAGPFRPRRLALVLPSVSRSGDVP